MAPVNVCIGCWRKEWIQILKMVRLLNIFVVIEIVANIRTHPTRSVGV